ncbi:MAG: hypothetical protein HOP19_06770 [Acidobacteria bacterium]|nr:hypothetical protein [Acidobacteriota bacterium]
MLQKFYPLVYLLFFFLTSALAQSDPPKNEIGVHAASVKPVQAHVRTIGGGVRFTYNLNAHLALEGEANLFNRMGIGYEMRGQLLGGLKAGARFNKFGLFGKIRPGIMRNEDFTFTNAPCFNFSQPPNSNLPQCRFEPITLNDFALDIGGVLEFYLARRWVIRFDVGDLIVRRRRESFTDVTTSPPISVIHTPAPDSVFTRHNLQVNAGVGFRF